LRVFGVDASTARSGFAVIDENGDLVHTSELDFKSSVRHRKRRREVRDRVREVALEHEPDFVIIERLRLFHGSKINFDTIVRLCSMFTTVADATKLKCWTVQTNSWKKAVLGSGTASKAAAVAYVEKRYKVKMSHDLADAICIALMGLKRGTLGHLFKPFE
jgi:Holliday junction resolvasome RuvABC endonuclease subunit